MRIYSISSCEWVLFNANSAIFQLHFCISWWEQHLETYCFYHYVKLYVSIIMHLEVININVRNFNFPIGFYSNPHNFSATFLYIVVRTTFGNLLFLFRFLLLLLLFSFFLSVDHELVHGRSQELVDRIWLWFLSGFPW
jgi:hypothetical protein